MTFHCLYFIFWLNGLMFDNHSISCVIILSFHLILRSCLRLLFIFHVSHLYISTRVISVLYSLIYCFLADVVGVQYLLKFCQGWSCFWNSAFHILHALILLVEKQNNAHRYTNLFTSSNLMLSSLLVGFVLGLFSCSYFCWHLSLIITLFLKQFAPIFLFLDVPLGWT